MTKKIRIACVLSLAVLATVAVPASAEIVIDGFAYWRGNNPTTGTFDASGSDTLVVLVTGEHGFNQTANGWISGVTYDGVEMTELINRKAIKKVADDPGTPEDETVLVDDTWNAIFYLDNPATSTGSISASCSSRGSIVAIALSGTAEGAGNTAIGPRESTTAELTTSAGSIVLASYGMGGSGNTAFVNNVTMDDPLTFLAKGNNGGGRWWDGHVTGYALDVAAGTATYSVTDTSTPGADGRTGAHLIAAEFKALAVDPTLPGDADDSGFVDDDDLAVLLSNWEQDPGTITTWELGDFTEDTDVDDDDLAVLLGNWTGPAPPGGAAVPEPATLALLGLGGLAMLRRRKC